MKYIFLLLLVVSCSTTTKTEQVPTESDAQPVSPLTVEPCYCMKIFQPVCAGDTTYGNSCEAECHGHKTWTEGNCGKTPKK
jgi:hypothetical protein